MGDVLLLLLQFGVGLAHRGDQGGDEAVQKRVGEPEQTAEARGAAEHAPQHVTASFVAWQGAIGQGEAERAQMIDDHPEGDVFFGMATVLLTRERCQPLEQRHEQIGIVVRTLALQDARDALEAQAGVHVLCGQGLQGTIAVAVVLDEHQISTAR